MKTVTRSTKDEVCIIEKGGDAEPKVLTITRDYV